MAVKEMTREVSEKALEGIGRAGKRGKDVLETASEKGRDVLGTAGEKTRDVIEDVAERAKEYAPKKIRARREKERKKERRRSLLKGLGIGLAVAYFFDPDNGKRRRRVARDRALSLIRTGTQRTSRLGRHAASRTVGAVQKVRHASDTAPPNDAALASKVESEVLGSSPLKAAVSVNAENGTIVLRGQVDRQEEAQDLEDQVRGVAGVRDVRNLLHLPGTPAPGQTSTG